MSLVKPHCHLCVGKGGADRDIETNNALETMYFSCLDEFSIGKGNENGV